MFLKITSVRFMDINLVQNVIHGGKFGQNRYFLEKMVKIGSFGIFWGQNDVICQNLEKVVKLFFPYLVSCADIRKS